DRARIAAERLFGLRLDASLTRSLVSRMQKLGMNELAETLANRMQGQHADSPEQLVLLMTQYVDSGRQGTAAQVARHLLTLTTGTRASRISSEPIRRQALQVLSNAGELTAMILQAEDQHTRDPNSVSLTQTLQEFYQAAGRTADAERMSQELSRLQPVNLDQLTEVAQQLDRNGRYDEACDRYVEILRRDPRRFSQNYYQYLRTFQQARRLPELADTLMAGDLRKLHNNYFVVNEVVEYLFNAGARGNNAGSAEREQGLELFAAAWKAFPANRTFMLGNVSDERIWDLPVMLEFAREGILPTSAHHAVAEPWHGIADSVTQPVDGRPTGTLSRLCRALKDPQALHDYRARVAAATEQFPAWSGGRLLLGVLCFKEHDFSGCAAALQSVAVREDVTAIPSSVLLLVSEELTPLPPECRDPMIRLLQKCERPRRTAAESDLRAFPALPLAVLLQAEGRAEEAGTLLRQTVTELTGSFTSDGGQRSLTCARTLADIGERFIRLSLSPDALSVLLRAKAEANTVSSTWSAELRPLHQRIDQLQTFAADRLTPETVVTWLARPPAESFGPPAGTITSPDLLLFTDGGSLEQSAVRSLLLESLVQPNAERDRARVADLTQRLLSELDRAAPENTSLSVAAAVFAGHFRQPQLLTKAFGHLSAYLNATEARASAEPAAAVPVTNTVPATEAVPASDLNLWPAVETALRHREYHEAGERMFRRSVRAARRHAPHLCEAMYRLRGEYALQAEDPATAETTWRELLGVILAAEDSAGSTGHRPDGESDILPTTALQELQRLLNSGR
ncbi:MAG: hypothetical protein KDA89_21150, partial [Planctomycetaceae bacterium]|nr:hypothetical protein [Planctomycetaceae bacterium]